MNDLTYSQLWTDHYQSPNNESVRQEISLRDKGASDYMLHGNGRAYKHTPNGHSCIPSMRAWAKQHGV